MQVELCQREREGVMGKAAKQTDAVDAPDTGSAGVGSDAEAALGCGFVVDLNDAAALVGLPLSVLLVLGEDGVWNV